MITKRKFVAFLMFALVVLAALTFLPLRRSEQAIRNQLLRQHPIGTPLSNIVQSVERTGREFWVNTNSGFWHQRVKPQVEVGEMSIRHELGEYRVFPLGTRSVTAFYGFDSSGRLIDIWVWKTTDSL